MALTTALGRKLDPTLAAGLLFIGLLPSTVQSAIAITSIARGNVAVALCSASVSSVFGLVLTPVRRCWQACC